jgi:hypothetical protein
MYLPYKQNNLFDQNHVAALRDLAGVLEEVARYNYSAKHNKLAPFVEA